MRASIAITFLFGLALCVVCSAVPVVDPEAAAELEFVGEHDLEAVADGTGLRQKRATCDLLSFLNVKDAACAAHCLAKGYRGGYCDGRKVCNCRR
uniref:Invertebrate defensins family profile domain-containing protein n=1 Tax=Eristalis tenax TaxID=198635 RepID=A4VBA2_ERITN|nr:hypothetical protein [Eristalis tenax]